MTRVTSTLGSLAFCLLLTACSCGRAASAGDVGAAIDGGETTEASVADDTAGEPLRCPEKRLDEDFTVQTDEELQALEGATHIRNLLIFRPVSTLEPLRCLEEIGSLITGSKYPFPSLEPLGNLRKVRRLELDSSEVDDLTPLQNLREVEKIFLRFPKVTSLAGLENLTSGWVLIVDTAITDLHGLENFRGHRLTLRGNEQLTSLRGLDSLERLEYLGLTRNGSLPSLETLPKVPIEDIVLDETAFTDLRGLEHITSANIVQITQNRSLRSLQGLHNLEELWSRPGEPGHLLIKENATENLRGLDSLRTVDGYVEIMDDVGEHLHSLDGLNALQHVTVKLKIVSNPALTSVDALRPDLDGSLTSVRMIEARVNWALPDCELTALAEAITAAGGPLGDLWTQSNLDDECTPQ